MSGQVVCRLEADMDPTKDQLLFDDGEHRIVYLGTQGMGRGDVEVNSYLIVNGDRGFLIDPGGYKIFPKVISNISKYIDPRNIDYIYMCHQDPDVAGSIPLWRKVSNAKVIIGWLWMRFLPHFGFEDVESVAHSLPDEGETLSFGSARLDFIPAHFLHSPSHFTIYDHKSRFLFSGDIGIAFLERPKLVVDDMEVHINAMKGLHERLMASNKAIKNWLNRVSGLEIEAVLPQHGAIIPKKFVERFFRFLESLKCGVDLT